MREGGRIYSLTKHVATSLTTFFIDVIVEMHDDELALGMMRTGAEGLY